MHPRLALKCLASAALAVFLLALLIPQMGFARKIAFNTIDPIATLSDGGGRIIITGPLRCDQVQWVDLRVTVTQRSTGACAEGRLRFAGTTAIEQWELEATTHGARRFEPGPATAVALAISNVGGKADDAHQWLVNITLQE